MTSSLLWAEVIGDPIAQSKSPVIHRFWLEALGIEGEYRAFGCSNDFRQSRQYVETSTLIPPDQIAGVYPAVLPKLNATFFRVTGRECI